MNRGRRRERTPAEISDERVLGEKRLRLRSSRVVLTTALRADPWRAGLLCLVTVASGLSGAVLAYALKVITDAVARQDTASIVPGVLVLSAAAGIVSTASIVGFMLRLRVVEATQVRIDQDLIRLTTGIPGLEHHERPEYVDQVDRLRERRQQLGQSVNSIVSAATVVTQVLSTVGLLAAVHPWLLLLPLFGVPSFFLQGRAERKRRVTWERTTERFRTTKHLFEIATTAAPAKELRIFGATDVLRRRHLDVRLGVASEMNRAGRIGVLLSTVGWLIFATGYAGALLFVVNRALEGSASPGDVILVVSLGTQVNEQVGGLVGTFSWLLQSLDAVRRWLWLSDHADAAGLQAVDRHPVPDRISSGLCFEGVEFRYPGTEAAVLERVDLEIPAGTTVAIVGDNGAGKSTLIKLLCRFYEPTSGRITLDGIDMRNFDVEEWRQRMAAGFQDFAKFELVARETVGVGHLRAVDDETAVHAALHRAHATNVVAALPDGLGAQLGKSFEGGLDLSGGQWQKLALGRAMMRENPLLLVLDEPTATLDAETEHALFERYAGAAREVSAGTGAITVLVSHRFSTVRMADLIVVVDGGRLAEVGSHSELIARDGLYAELYELQARAYR